MYCNQVGLILGRKLWISNNKPINTLHHPSHQLVDKKRIYGYLKREKYFFLVQFIFKIPNKILKNSISSIFGNTVGILVGKPTEVRNKQVSTLCEIALF